MNRIIFTITCSVLLSLSAQGFNEPTYPDLEEVFIKPKKKIFKNRREKRRIGIHFGAIGPTEILSASLDGFITPKIAIEAGAGLNPLRYPENVGDLSYFLGARYHLFGKTKLNLTPFVGIYTVFHHNGSTVRNHSLYIPVGLHKIKRKGFCWSAEVAYQRNIYTTRSLSGSFKIGYQF